jgi:hypothetical protein
MNPSFSSQPVSKKNISSATFYLLDNNGNHIDLNGLDFTFTFVLYKNNNYYQHMLDDRRVELELSQLQYQKRQLEQRLEQQKNEPALNYLYQ